MNATPSAVASVASSWSRATLEVVLYLFVRQHVDLFVARATQRDGTAFATSTRTIFGVFPVLTPRVRHEMMRGDLTHLTVAECTRWHDLALSVG
jgi:hypothetical protein